MIKVTRMSEEELNEAGRDIARAFCNHEGNGIFQTLGLEEESVAGYMKALLRYGISAGELYITSENREGYVCYSDSRKEKTPLIASARMLWESIAALGFDGYRRYSVMFLNAGYSQENRYRQKMMPYIGVSLLAVAPAYQHHGFMRQMLDEIFAEADREDLPVLLQTDTEDKMLRYCHLGMQCSGVRNMGSGVKYYDLIREPGHHI